MASREEEFIIAGEIFSGTLEEHPAYLQGFKTFLKIRVAGRREVPYCPHIKHKETGEVFTVKSKTSSHLATFIELKPETEEECVARTTRYVIYSCSRYDNSGDIKSIEPKQSFTNLDEALYSLEVFKGVNLSGPCTTSYNIRKVYKTSEQGKLFICDIDKDVN